MGNSPCYGGGATSHLARGSGRGRVYDDITATIGNTPCVRINGNLAPEGRTIFAKLEYFNPLSSVKDRLAIAVIEDAEKKGLLKKGDTVIEATSGNTGIALAMVCAQRGYKCVICMAETFSIERRKTMRMLGAKVILTPKSGKGTGMVKKAAELAEKNGWFLCHQFENTANPEFHALTTGPEIINDFRGRRLDYFVLGYGTGGTFAGAGRVLKKQLPNIKLVLAEPEAAPLILHDSITVRNDDGSAKDSHPAFKPHPIQGWTPDFIPKILEDGLVAVPYDHYIPIPGEKAIETAQKLAQTQGIFTGISGGGSVYAAIEMAKKAPEGSTLVCIVADTGERYLSTPLFTDILAEMSEEEQSISKSTPNFQLAN